MPGRLRRAVLVLCAVLFSIHCWAEDVEDILKDIPLPGEEKEKDVLEKLPLSGEFNVSSEALVGGVEVRSEHPRLFLSPENLQRLRERARKETPRWKRLKNSGGLLERALVYQITGEKSYADKAISQLMKEEKDVNTLSLGYDWLYDRLSAEQREIIVFYMNILCSGMKSTPPSGPWHNHAQWALVKFAYAGLATYGKENPSAAKWINIAYDVYWRKFFLAGFEIAGKGGGWPEGCVYSFMNDQSFALFAAAFSTATNIDIFSQTPWFFDRLSFYLLMNWPKIEQQGSYGYWAYPSLGDSERWRGTMVALEHACQLVLIDRYRDTSEARQVKWCLNQLPGQLTRLPLALEFLWYDPDIPEEKPTKLAHFAEGTGTVFLRSHWGEDATCIGYQCGDRFIYHQHMDQGSFILYKKGDLAIESGVYPPDCPHGEGFHNVAYYSRAIAHNTMLIYNPKETFYGYRAWGEPCNDGGQRMWIPASNNADSPEYWKKHQRFYETGNITAFEHKKEYTYIASDVTAAYNSTRCCAGKNEPKIEEFTRQLVYLRPAKPGEDDFLLIFDRVKTTKPEYDKKWLLHFLNEPMVEGKATYASAGEYLFDGNLTVADAGEGRLFCKTLLPIKHRIRKVGGRDVKDYWIFGVNFVLRAATPWETDYGAWRIEVEPAMPAKEDFFLHLLYPVADKHKNSMPQGNLLEGDRIAGVEVEASHATYRVLFFKEGPLGGHIIILDDKGKTVIDTDFALSGKVEGDVKVIPSPETKLKFATISEVNVSAITDYGATISWVSSLPTTSGIEYGLTQECRSLTPVEESLVKEHRISLAGLKAGKEYYFRVRGRNAEGSISYSAQGSFTTTQGNPTPPVISAVSSQPRIYPAGVDIFWQTDSLCGGEVEYGLTSEYSSKAQVSKEAVYHQATIAPLKYSTTYHYRIRTKSADGKETVSKDYTFTTPPESTVFREDFTSGATRDWNPMTPDYWEVAVDKVTGRKGYHLKDTARSVAEMSIYEKAEFGDFTMRWKARSDEEGNEFADYFVVFGYQDPKNYYLAWMNQTFDWESPGIIRCKDGKWERIGYRRAYDGWWWDIAKPHEWKLSRKGERIVIELVELRFFSSQRKQEVAERRPLVIFEAKDETFGKGKIGFGSYNDSVFLYEIEISDEVCPLREEPRLEKEITCEGILIE